MRQRLLLLLLSLTLALLPMAAGAQGPEAIGDVIVRYNGPLRIGPGETVPNALVVNQDATIDGTVRGSFGVIDGNATISGRVDGSTTVVNGRLDLGQGAQVSDVNLVNSTLNRAPGAIVNGEIRSQTGILTAAQQRTVSFFFWLGTTLAVIVAGLIFAAVGGRQLTGAGRLMVEQPAGTVIAALIVSIGLPLLAFLAFVTLIGIPVGFTLLFLLGALWFLGFLVSGALLGAALVSRVRPRGEPLNLYLAVVIGLLVLEVVGLIPFIGFVIMTLAGFLGSGALALLAWRAWRQPGAPREELAPPTPGRPAAPA
ncbi:RDD domain-containing protein [Nitrolancea hollandica]|uniref:RDD domain-containing protein n=1 Tax=Nitrolancea hollandica Lb TaxID=1129897 RepID=I4EJP6_9BACT|nr:RDD domain-containing protein [Nitrolancea hollandica]CCF84908.1 RDD domain-containing protein [Nitrolancea hollandica Lb]